MNLRLFFTILFAVAAPLQSASARNASSFSRNGDRVRYVGFINERDLAWRPFEVEGVPPGVEVKLLSGDGESGAVSLIARLPAGWVDAAGHHASDMEMFALKGAAKIGDRRFTDRRGAYVPAGVPYGPAPVEKETIALWFFDGALHSFIGEFGRSLTAIATASASPLMAQTGQAVHRTFMGPARAEATIEISGAAASGGVTINT